MAPVAVVLCHGFVVDATCWRAQLYAHARHSPVVTWDRGGYRGSETGPGDHLTIEQVGNDVRSVIEQIAPDGTVVLSGTRWGHVDYRIADQHPELFGTWI